VNISSKERDAETGLDFFGARYMSSAQGRFTSPDPKMFPHDTDPQSWNKYSYTRNNPLRYVDPNERGLAGECHARLGRCEAICSRPLV
jgi:RHS repeat-associated protein